MGRLNCYVVHRGGSAAQVVEAVDEPETALAARGPEDRYAWFDLCDPSLEDFAPLRQALGLHELAIEDCLDDEQVPKAEDYPDNLFALVTRWRSGADGQLTEEINFFLGRGYLVTVHGRGLAGEDASRRWLQVAEHHAEQVRLGPDWLMHAVLDTVVDEKLAAIEAVQDNLDQIEESLLTGSRPFNAAEVIGLRRDLLRLRKSLVYERETVGRLARPEVRFISAEARYAFRDVQDHLIKFFEMVEICRELVASITEIHLSAVSNSMAQIGNKTNFVMRRLTLITTVFMPLTLLSGIGGMSEYSAMTGGEANYWWSYPLFMLAMVCIAFVSYRVLKWFDARDPETGSALDGERAL